MSGTGAVVVVVALETACGFGVLALFGVGGSWAQLGRRAGLAPLAGMTWSGIAGATLATAGTRLSLVGLVVVTVGTCAAGVSRMRARQAPPAPPRAKATRAERLVVIAFLTGIAVVATLVVAAVHDKPLLDYDGWAMWGMKAKAIAVLGSADPAVFAGDAYERLHLEYPLLIPTLHALPLQALDSYSSNTINLNCVAIAAAGLLAIWGTYRDRVRPTLLCGFLAATLAMPELLWQVGTGYADVPLAMFVAAGVAAAARWLVDREGMWLGLATLFLTAATLTKNEGLLFAACVYVALFLAARGRRRALALSASAVAVAYAPWQLYTTLHGLKRPDFDLWSSFDVPWVAERLDRAPIAARTLLEHALEPREYGLVVLLMLAATALGLVVGHRALAVFAGGFALLSFAGLTWIYVLTPYDLSFYLSTNINRVVMAPIVSVAVLAPILVEESVQALEARERKESSAPPGSLVRGD